MPGGAAIARLLWRGWARCLALRLFRHFQYTFWPSGYDPGYWAYAYDDFVDTVFWGADSPYSAYASLSSEGGGASAGYGYQSRARASASPQALRQLCADPDKGVTAWPIASITRAVRPTPEQRALLDELKTSAAKATTRSSNPAPIPMR